MAYILCIETATKICSVALFNDSHFIDYEEQGGSYSHAENLAVFIDQLLKRQGVNFSDLSAVAVTKGPGSYTGLRIGVSLAKGVAYAANIPLIAIDSLKSMAWGAIQQSMDDEAYYCPMIDARRMEVYAAIYNAKLQQVREIDADLVEADTYRKYFDHQKVYFFGDGAEKCQTVIQHSNAVFMDQEASAKNMGVLAFEAFQTKSFEDIAYFEPFYLKEFVALKSKKKLI